MTVKVILAIIGAVMIGGFAFLGFQFNNLNGKLDTISSSLSAKIEANPQRLSEELRVMRAEMAAETSAIADSITANKQVQGPQPAPAPQPPLPQIVTSPRQPSRP
jgi:outer membrane murein-binding lipoprotein Lpp